jgi:hypothetical protein
MFNFFQSYPNDIAFPIGEWKCLICRQIIETPEASKAAAFFEYKAYPNEPVALICRNGHRTCPSCAKTRKNQSGKKCPCGEKMYLLTAKQMYDELPSPPIKSLSYEQKAEWGETYMLSAEKLLGENKAAEALDGCNLALKYSPDLKRAIIARALCMRVLDTHPQALEYISAAIEIEPLNGDLRLTKAIVHLNRQATAQYLPDQIKEYRLALLEAQLAQQYKCSNPRIKEIILKIQYDVGELTRYQARVTPRSGRSVKRR